MNEDKFRAIIENYKSKCKEQSLEPNKSWLRTLEEYITQRVEDLVFIFLGNHKLNFTSRLKDSDIIIITHSMESYAENLRHIDLSYNNITDDGAIEIAKIMMKTNDFESLNLQGNMIESSGAKALSKALKITKRVRYLNLDSNKIKVDGAMSIVEVLFSTQNIVELNLANNEIDHDGIISITSVLNWNNTSLVVLNIDNPYYTSIGQETAIHFGKMLQNNKSIEKLSCKKHSFTCDAIFTICKHLRDNSRLRVLDLTANRISFKGCEAIAEYLTGEFCALESLILASNRTGHYGAKAIANALTSNKSLVHLDMTTNDIDDNGLRMIGEALFYNQNLTSIKLYQNHFGQPSLGVFYDLFTGDQNRNWFPDFVTYLVDDKFQMAYLETKLPYDVSVSSNHYFTSENEK